MHTSTNADDFTSGGGVGGGRGATATAADGLPHILSSYAQRTAESAYRVPTPPRILIPPPSHASNITGANARNRNYSGLSTNGGNDESHVRCDSEYSHSNSNGNGRSSDGASNGMNNDQNNLSSSGNNGNTTANLHDLNNNNNNNNNNANSSIHDDNLFIPLPQTSFLPTTNYHSILQQNSIREWAYERRREAQIILPYLYLGPMSSARDETFLRREGITCLLGIRQTGGNTGGGLVFGGAGLGSYVAGGVGKGNGRTGGMPESKLMNGTVRTADKLGLEHHTVDLATHQDLIRAFPFTTRLIVRHLARAGAEAGAGDQAGAGFGDGSGRKLTSPKEMKPPLTNKVLVFCESGNERSAGVVAAFLMEAHANVDYIRAIQICQAQRFCVSFDDAMKGTLQSYWDILCARRAVEGVGDFSGVGDGVAMARDEVVEMSGMMSGGGEASMTPPRAKRGLDRSGDDGDEEMEDVNADADDVERFEGRRHWTPFVDYDGL